MCPWTWGLAMGQLVCWECGRSVPGQAGTSTGMYKPLCRESEMGREAEQVRRWGLGAASSWTVSESSELGGNWDFYCLKAKCISPLWIWHSSHEMPWQMGCSTSVLFYCHKNIPWGAWAVEYDERSRDTSANPWTLKLNHSCPSQPLDKCARNKCLLFYITTVLWLFIS